MRCLFGLLLILCLTGCSTRSSLEVDSFFMRDFSTPETDEPMVRMEKLRRLHGALTAAERNDRLGHYYTMHWSDPAGAGKGEIEIVFEYQQGSTASQVKRQWQRFASSDRKGKAEFRVTGNDYLKGGRVLAWKATLKRGGREIESHHSYLWE
ncbi:MAG: hypothetical protein KGQ87_09460 [Verrucomicrobia bacterium]|nr:hypothetical protein [Verrucomicrobiota bacterium]